MIIRLYKHHILLPSLMVRFFIPTGRLCLPAKSMSIFRPLLSLRLVSGARCVQPIGMAGVVLMPRCRDCAELPAARVIALQGDGKEKNTRAAGSFDDSSYFIIQVVGPPRMLHVDQRADLTGGRLSMETMRPFLLTYPVLNSSNHQS